MFLLFLLIFMFYLNWLYSVVLAHSLWALATFPVCSSVFRSSKNKTPVMSSSLSFLRSCKGSCFQGTTITLMVLRVCLSKFQLSTLFLISSFTIYSPRQSSERGLLFWK